MMHRDGESCAGCCLRIRQDDAIRILLVVSQWLREGSHCKQHRSTDNRDRAHDGTSFGRTPSRPKDRKSTRLNSSHGYISYAVFCLKKKKTTPLPRKDC